DRGEHRLGLVSPAVAQDGLGYPAHLRVDRAYEMIGVDDHVHSGIGESNLMNAAVAGRDHHQRNTPRKLVVVFAEFEDVAGIRSPTVDHNAVGPGIHVSLGALYSFVHPLIEDQTFDTCDDHEVVGDLSSFTRSDELTKV